MKRAGSSHKGIASVRGLEVKKRFAVGDESGVPIIGVRSVGTLEWMNIPHQSAYLWIPVLPMKKRGVGAGIGDLYEDRPD